MRVLLFIDRAVYRLGGVFARYWYLLTILGAITYFRHDELTAFSQQQGNTWPVSELESFLMMVLSPFFIWYQRVWVWAVNGFIESYNELTQGRGGGDAP